jgi:hypothetical protein
MFYSTGYKKGNTTVSMMTFSMMTFSMMTCSMMTFSMMTFSMMTFSIASLSIIVSKCGTLSDINVMLSPANLCCVVILSVIILNVDI